MRSFLCFIIVAAVCTVSVLAQKVEMAGLPVKPSTLVEDLKVLRSTQPKMPAAEFATEANKLLDKQGMNFSLFLDAGTCTRVSDVRAKQKDPNAPIRLGGSLQSTDGDRTKLELPAAQFAPTGCGGCYLNLPILQITNSTFITVLMGRNIGFNLPSNLTPVRAVLLDDKDLRTVKRVWSIPERMEPIGVTHDENVLYLAFRQPELADLSLAVFTEGTFQISTRAEADEGGKGQLLSSNPSQTAMKIMKFSRWGKLYQVGYSEPCRTN